MADHLYNAFVSAARYMVRCYTARCNSPFMRIHFPQSVLTALLFSAIPGLSFTMSMPAYAVRMAVSRRSGTYRRSGHPSVRGAH